MGDGDELSKLLFSHFAVTAILAVCQKTGTVSRRTILARSFHAKKAVQAATRIVTILEQRDLLRSALTVPLILFDEHPLP